MSKKISQLQSPDIVTGQELIPVSIGGDNFSIKVNDITSLVTKNSLGINDVDNTKDADKPVSRATQAALNEKVNVLDFNTLSNTVAGKANTVHTHTLLDITGLDTAFSDVNNAIEQTNGYIQQVSTNLQVLTNRVDSIVIPTSFPISAVTNLQATLTGINNAVAGKANFVHKHTTEDIIGLDDKINNAITQSVSISFGTSEW